MNAGTIQGEFGWSNSPLIAGMRDAENIASKGAANVQNKFASIFKRSPNMRAERAISGSLQAFASGDIAGGIQDITSRMTGLGLAAGVAIGAGVAIFEKFREQIVATRKAHEALEEEMIKRPVSGVVGLSESGMSQALERRQKLAADLTEQSQHRFGSELKETFESLMNAPGVANFSKTTGKERLGVETDLSKASSENKEIMKSRAQLAQKLVDLKSQELFGDEHAARIGMIMAETEQKRAELKQQGLTHVAFQIADKAAQTQGGVALAVENKREESKERSLAIEEKMTRLTRLGLKPEDQRKVRAGLELKDLDQQIAGETDPMRKRILVEKRGEKENEIRAANPQEAGNPFAFGTTAARNWESDQGGFGTIAERSKETENAGSFGSLAQSAALRGESPMGKATDPAVVKVLNEIKTIVSQAWLTP
jgi:hypothetical protein